MIRHSYRRADSPLARTIRAALRTSGFSSVKEFEARCGLPALALGAFIRSPSKQSPPRRYLVLIALEAYLGVTIAEIAALAGIASDGNDLAPPDPLDGLKPEQVAAAETLRKAAAGMSWPGLEPEPASMRFWSSDLRRLWHVLRGADTDFSRRGLRCVQPSFAVWRILVEGETANWFSPRVGNDMASLERAAFVAGLDAIAAQVIGEAA